MIRQKEQAKIEGEGNAYPSPEDAVSSRALFNICFWGGMAPTRW